MDANTPEKVPRTASERKRKRKADDGGGSAPGGSVTSKGARSVSALDNKKINEYFPKHHLANSPIRHGGAKSPSPQQGYPMVRSKTNRILAASSYLSRFLYTMYIYFSVFSLPTVSTIASTVT